MEHLRHFQLSDDPFRNEPLMRSMFEASPQEDALRRLERAVRQARGLSVLLGSGGSGKTMTVRRLLDSLEEDLFEAGMMVVLPGAADADWMLRRYAVQLGVEEPAAEREGLIGQIYEALCIVREDGRHAVLIIDDAHALSQPSALSEICGLLKLEYEDRRLLSLVLAGPDSLASAFSRDPNLAHRIDVRVELAPLSSEAGAAYLDHRIRQVGGHPTILDDEAIGSIHELGGGYPGRMNTLADNALFEAFLCGRRQLTRVDVERAYADLGWGVAIPNGLTQRVEASPVGKRSAQPASDSVQPTGSEMSFEDTLTGLDEELAGVLKSSSNGDAVEGPPKEDADDPEDLLVELVDA